MSAGTPFISPKKKPNIFWWIGGAIFVLLVLFLFQLAGPGPRIFNSPKTTHIAGPLGPDGLPDYHQYILDLYREGVTPENNAAALIWPALWPGELTPNEFAAVAKELGLDHVPTIEDALIPIHKQIQRSLKEQYAAAHNGPNASNDPNDAVNAENELEDKTDRVFDLLTQQPWTTDQFPAFGAWAHDNQQPLDQLVEASHRSRCYFPSPSLLKPTEDSLIEMTLPGVQAVREAGRSLSARAMWSLGEHRIDDAWRDLYAAHRIGHLVAQGQIIIEQVVGMAISGIACEGTVTLLHNSSLTPAQARQILADLDRVENFDGIGDAVDHMERASFLNAVILHSQGKLSDEAVQGIGAQNMEYSKYLAIDWNVALERGNNYFDRYAAAMRLPTHAARKQALDQLDGALGRPSLGTDSVVQAVLSRSARSDAAASLMVALLLPALSAANDAQDRENTVIDLTRLAAALAVYRADHGAYPQKLDDLVPSVLPKLLVDLYNAKPFVYERKDDGYLLYSLGENGVDDGGSNYQRSVFEGHFYPPSEDQTNPPPKPIPEGADDIAIRVPRLPIKIPAAPTP